MLFHDPARPRLASGRPCWASAPLVALPHLTLDPQEDGTWLIAVMYWDMAREAGSWVTLQFAAGQVPGVLQNWSVDPERTLREIFGREPPSAQAAPATIMTETSLEDLDL